MLLVSTTRLERRVLTVETGLEAHRQCGYFRLEVDGYETLRLYFFLSVGRLSLFLCYLMVGLETNVSKIVLVGLEIFVTPCTCGDVGFLTVNLVLCVCPVGVFNVRLNSYHLIMHQFQVCKAVHRIAAGRLIEPLGTLCWLHETGGSNTRWTSLTSDDTDAYLGTE